MSGDELSGDELSGDELPGDELAERWNALPRTDRIYVRRVVRHGLRFKPGEDDLAALGRRWAAHQRSRLVQRLWWLWFLPGMLVGLSIAVTIHPLAVGVVLAAGAQAAVVHRNLKKAATRT